MPIEISCPGCGARLRLPDDAAGKQAQCPKCQTTFAASNPSTGNPAAATAASSADNWTVKMSNGQSYGPVSKTQLDTWVSEGRVTGDSQLSRDGQAGWHWARDVYPMLASARGMPMQPAFAQPSAAPDEFKVGVSMLGPNSPSPVAGDPASGANPYSSPASANPAYYGDHGRYWRPHRGGLILALGILGCFVCGFLAIAAWVMGSGDLKEIRAGRMDPTGEGLTQAGMIVGIIGCVWMVISFFGLFMLFGALAVKA